MYADVVDYLPTSAWNRLRAFAASAGRAELTPSDWRRFYDFVRSCHLQRALLSRESLVGFLSVNGFAAPLAQQLGSVYLHGRALLAAGQTFPDHDGQS
jgi:hypothetical protein